MFKVGTPQPFFTKIEHNGVWHTSILQHNSDIEKPYVLNTEISLVSIDQLELDQFTTMINGFKSGPWNFFSKLNTMVHQRLKSYTTLEIYHNPLF